MSFGSTAPIPSFIKPQQERQVCEHSKDPLARILAQSQRRVNRVKTTGRNDRLIPRTKPANNGLDPTALEELLVLARDNVAGVSVEKQKVFNRQLGEMCTEISTYQARVMGSTTDSKWLSSFYKVLAKMLHETLSHTCPTQLLKLSAALWQWYQGKKQHFSRLEEVEKKKEENARKTKNVHRDWGMMRQKHPDKFGPSISPTWGHQYGPYRAPTSCGELEEKGFACVPHEIPPPTPPPPRRIVAPAIGSPAPPTSFSAGTIHQGAQSAANNPTAVRADQKTWLGMFMKRDLASHKVHQGVNPGVRLPVRAANTAMASGVKDEIASILPYQNHIYRRPATSLGFVPSADAITLKKAKSDTRCKLGFAFYDSSSNVKEQHMHEMYVRTVEAKLHNVQRRGLLT